MPLRDLRAPMLEGAKTFGKMVAGGVAGAAATATVSGLAVAGSRAFDSLTKARDFKNMMKSPWSKDLQELHDQEPEKFNAAFTSLRSVNPALTKDPMLSSAYMRRIMQYDPAGATGVMVEALAAKDRAQPNLLMDAASRGAQTGVQHVFQDRANEQSQMHQARYTHWQEQERLRAKESPLEGGASAAERDQMRKLDAQTHEAFGRVIQDDYKREQDEAARARAHDLRGSGGGPSFTISGIPPVPPAGGGFRTIPPAPGAQGEFPFRYKGREMSTV